VGVGAPAPGDGVGVVVGETLGVADGVAPAPGVLDTSGAAPGIGSTERGVGAGFTSRLLDFEEPPTSVVRRSRLPIELSNSASSEAVTTAAPMRKASRPVISPIRTARPLSTDGRWGV